MKSIKSTVKSLAKGAVIGAGLLIATSAFADHRDWDRHDQDRDRGHEWHERHFDHDHDGGRRDDDWGGGDYDRRHYDHDGRDFDRDRGGLRLVLPFPPHPRLVLPFLPPPPVPVFVTTAQVVNVDPIMTRVPDYRRNRDWDNDGYGRDDHCEQRIDGYRVTYLFRGREYTTEMSYNPGDRIRIRVGNGIEVLQ